MDNYLRISLLLWKQCKWLWTLAAVILISTSTVNAGRHRGGNRGGNNLMELLTAGIVAKVLQKQDGDGGSGGGSGYYPVHIPYHVGGGGGGGYGHARHAPSHHHVTEKIIPIPIPQHTTRIIHINAGQGGDANQQLGQLLSGGADGAGYSDYGQSQYDGGQGGDQGYESQTIPRKPSKKSSQASSATIQHLLFSDTGLFGPPPPPPPPPSPAMAVSPYVMGSAAHRYYAVRRPMNPYLYDPRIQAAYVRGRPYSMYATQRWPSSYGSGMGYYGKTAPSPVVYAAYPTRSSWASSSPQVMISRIPYRRW